MSNKIILIACGSYNPPTFMHLRMFEIAKDHFTQIGYEVLGGIVSPVHDAYGKKDLMTQTHRLAMLKIATQSSNWIRISEWEIQQEGWSRTRQVLQYHQNYLNSIIRDLNGLISKGNLPSWVPENIRQIKDPVQIKLLCGADLLESFATPGLWDPDDIAAIVGNHGIIVVSRNDSNLDRFIFDSDLLSKYKRNITVVTNWIPNEVSSTLVRKFIKRELSVKYLIDDHVIDYIHKHGLYQTIANNDDTNKYILPPSSQSVASTIDVILTPISPESETSTFNESYVKKQNERNESSAVEEFESMDEGDFPVMPPPPPSKASLTVDFVATNSLHKVFCCGSADGTNVRILPRPGSAVQVHSGDDTCRTEKVGAVEQYAQNAINNTHDDDFGALDTDETQSPRSPEQNNAQDDDQTDSESLNAPVNKAARGRFSPKTYDEMIKFVFTEHGIKVISDKEYVV